VPTKTAPCEGGVGQIFSLLTTTKRSMRGKDSYLEKKKIDKKGEKRKDRLRDSFIITGRLVVHLVRKNGRIHVRGRSL